jgi:ribonuclease HI
MQPKEVIIYTDGACSGNPGRGGWGALLKYQKVQKEIYGGHLSTTNNRMELTAVIEALKLLSASCQVILYTDSKYVQEGISNWIHIWKKNGWKNTRRQPVANQDLWQELDQLAKKHQIDWVWVKGHATSEANNRADFLARQGINKFLNKDLSVQECFDNR